MHLLKVIKVSYIWFPVSTYSYNFSIEKPKLEAILSTFESVKMEELSDDSWNYFREDPLLHAFHNTYHTVLSHLHYIGFSRTSEIFQYMHQQLLRRSIIMILSITHHFIEIKRKEPRIPGIHIKVMQTCFRAALERKVLELPDFEPLDPERMGQSLGPTYEIEIIREQGIVSLVGRKQGCDLSRENCRVFADDFEVCRSSGDTWVSAMTERHQNLLSRMSSEDYETFGTNLEWPYHALGHTRIGFVCSPRKHEGIPGVMLSPDSSARDPIFYSWHLHIEELFEKYKDTVQGPYTRRDFTLSDGLKVLEVKTIMDKSQVGTRNDVENILVTYDEDAATGMKIYNKINHKDYTYQIRISNPQRTIKKVIVRIWLALSRFKC